jgi:membrane fusion protein, multidrug efflux system
VFLPLGGACIMLHTYRILKAFRFLTRNQLLAIFFLILGLLVLALILTFLKNSTPPNIPKKVVEVTYVDYSSIALTTKVIGVIKSQKESALRASENGILKITPNLSQFVKKNDLIAKILNENIQKKYKILSDMEIIAKNQLNRASNLRKLGAVHEKDFEEQRFMLLKIQKEVSDICASSTDLNIYAPFDGFIGTFKVKDGCNVHIGDDVVSI